MTLLHAVSILAVALGQAEPGPAAPPSVPAPPKIRLSEPRLIPLPGPDPAAARPPGLVEEGAPALRPDRESRCLERASGGRWRAQCDDATKRCLVAPDAELSSKGAAIASLDRAPACLVPGWREADLAAQGYTLVPALAESPPGWRRDERQRVMRVDFDLGRRVWLGAGYGVGGLPGSDAGEATAGVRWDVPFRLGGAPALARLRALETFASLDGDAVDFTAAGVEAPLVRLTTLAGAPRRLDPPRWLGGWLEAARVESLRTEAGWYDRVAIGAAALTLDLWRSKDLASFVRLRGGAGYEVAEQLSGAAWVPHAALDAELGLDRAGLHRLRVTAVSEWLVTTGADDYQPEDPAVARLPEDRTRLTAKAEYEVVLAALSDRPVSAVLDVRAQRRDDVPGFPEGWRVQGTASLRVNLFAPARRDAPVQERL